MTLLYGYLTAAADIVDFAENSSNETIAEKFGIDFTWGMNFFYLKNVYFQKLYIALKYNFFNTL